jgi:hypothetical protein
MLAVTAAALGVGGSWDSAPAHAKTRGESKPSQLALARKIAKALSQADTEAERRKALLGMLRGLGVGVYRPDGTRILRGGERGPNDFYLYDFELRTLATGMSRGDEWTLEEIANDLSSVFAGRDPQSGGPAVALITGAKLRELLRAGTQRALKSPAAPGSFAALLHRELGRTSKAPSDPTSATPDAELRFGPLQRWLMVADTLVPLVKKARPARPSAAGARTSPPMARAAGPCEDLKTNFGSIFKGGKWAISTYVLKQGLSQLKGQTRKALKRGAAVAAIALDGIHGATIAAGVAVSGFDMSGPEPGIETAPTSFVAATTAGQSHYGPPGAHPEAPDGTAGRQLRFKMRVRMLDDLPEAVKCGWLAGYDFPDEGVMKGVGVTWGRLGFAGGVFAEGLDDHGKFDGGTGLPGSMYATTTDDQGISRLVFTPNNEVVPGVGEFKTVEGTMSAIALYQAGFESVTGNIAQFLTPKGVDVTWQLGYHKPRGFKFKAHRDWNNTYPGDQQPYEQHNTWEGRVCGEEIYGVPWEGRFTFQDDERPEDSSTQQRTWTFEEGAPLREESGGLFWELELMPASGQTRVTSNYYYSFQEYTIYGALEEDLTCPPLE